MRLNKWAAFWILGLIWGSSFLFIRIGVEQVSPFQLVFIRTAIAAVGLNVVLALQRKHLPLNWRAFYPLLVLGAFNTVVPFALITWGEQSVDSGLASVLNATAALFTLVFAHFAFADERITPRKLAGLLLGFAGVVVLASGSITSEGLATSTLTGQLAIVLAAMFYGIGGTYGRGVVRELNDPIMVSAGAMTTAAVISGILMLVSPSLGGGPMAPFASLHGDALVSLLVLGIVNTFGAYLIYYYVVQQLGAARSSMVTYIIPPVGIGLGVIVLGEQVDARLILGAALILCGIAIVNVRMLSLRRQQTAAASPSPAAD
jgi:drug/metabolite transporter (DMT)-like permease